LLGASTIKALTFGLRSLIIPPILWLLLLSVRATRALYRNRKSYRAGYARNFARLCVLVPIIAVVDSAAIIGSFNWLMSDYLRPQKSRGQDDSRE
jgi:hypothetical protein